MVFFDRASISGDAPKYLVVRIQAPVELVNVTVREYAWEATLMNVSVGLSELRGVATDLGWGVKATEHPDGTSTAYLGRDTSNCSLTPRVEGKPKSGSASTYDLRISMKGVGERECMVNAVTTLLKSATGKPIEVNPKLVRERTQQSVKVGVDESTLKAALAYELKWLGNIGAVKDLSDEDITAIVKAAKAGMAGWNSRLVYANSVWMPYNEALKYIPGAALIRGCGDISKLVNQASLSTPAAQTITLTTTTTTTVTQATNITPQQPPPSTKPPRTHPTINPQALAIAALAGIAATATVRLIAKHKR